MAKNPVLPIYYNDLNGSTQDWTDEEFGAYMRLLIYQWDKGFIPSEMRRLTRIAESTEKNWTVLSQKFTPDEQGFLKNSVMEKIRTDRQKFLSHQSENGKKGGRPKNPNKTQSISQLKVKKKPLEREDEKEDELEKEFVMPFTSENFRVSWRKWKDYRKSEHGKVYKSSSEKAALTHLEKLSNGNESIALLIIDQSIAYQWQGLFEIKTEQKNGSSKTRSHQKSDASERFLEKARSEFIAAGGEANN